MEVGSRNQLSFEPRSPSYAPAPQPAPNSPSASKHPTRNNSLLTFFPPPFAILHVFTTLTTRTTLLPSATKLRAQFSCQLRESSHDIIYC
jgi:hypothetical protein